MLPRKAKPLLEDCQIVISNEMMHNSPSSAAWVLRTYAFYGCDIQHCLLLKDCQVVISKELHDYIAAPMVLSQTPLH